MSGKPLSKVQIICYVVISILFTLLFIFFCYCYSINQKNVPKIPSKKEQQLLEKKKLTDVLEENDKKKLTDASEENNVNFKPSNTEKFLSFEDLIGFSEEKEALDGFIHYMKNKANYVGIGKVEPPLGILFYGVPGTGKTTLARAVAKETGLPFFEVASSVFSQKYIGVAPQMVRELFENARKATKESQGAIIFLDECETIFTNLTQSEEIRETANIVNQFKTELTSMHNDPAKPIFIIGATNRYEEIDAAVKSRFTYHIEIKPGNFEDRRAFLKFMIDRRGNLYNAEAETFLLEDINKRLDGFKNDQEYLKTNRTLENLLKTTVSVFARNRQIEENSIEKNSILKLRNKINKKDIEKAYQIVIGKKYS